MYLTELKTLNISLLTAKHVDALLYGAPACPKNKVTCKLSGILGSKLYSNSQHHPNYFKRLSIPRNTLSLSVQLRSRRHIHFDKRSEANWHIITVPAPTNKTTRRHSQWLPPVLTYVLHHFCRTSSPWDWLAPLPLTSKELSKGLFDAARSPNQVRLYNLACADFERDRFSDTRLLVPVSSTVSTTRPLSLLPQSSTLPTVNTSASRA